MSDQPITVMVCGMTPEQMEQHADALRELGEAVAKMMEPEGGTMDEQTVYCAACRLHVQAKDPELVPMANGRQRLSAHCSKCGKRVSKLLSNAQTAELSKALAR